MSKLSRRRNRRDRHLVNAVAARPHAINPLSMAVSMALAASGSQLFGKSAYAGYLTCNSNRILDPTSVIGTDSSESNCLITTLGGTEPDAALTVESTGELTNNAYLHNGDTATDASYTPGSLTIESGGVLNNNSLLSNDVGGQLSNYGTLNNNYGATLYNAGNLLNAGTLNNLAGSTLTSVGMLDNQGTLSSRGEFNAAYLDHSGSLYNFGTLNVDNFTGSGGFLENTRGATLTVDNLANVNLRNNGYIHVSGQLNLAGGYNYDGTIVADSFYNTGSFEGRAGVGSVVADTFTNSGSIRQAITVTGIGANTGDILGRPGRFTAASVLTIASTGAFTNDGGFTGRLYNDGHLTNNSGMTAYDLFNRGDIVNFGSLGSALASTSSGDILNVSGATITNHGFLAAAQEFRNEVGAKVYNRNGGLIGFSGWSGSYSTGGLSTAVNNGYWGNDAGASISLTQGQFDNYGSLINVGNIYLRRYTQYTNDYQGYGARNPIRGGVLINHAGATITNSGLVDNHGQITNAGSFDNSGNIRIEDTGPPPEYLHVPQAARFTNTGMLTNQSGGTIELLSGSAELINSGTVNNNGTISNQGIVHVEAGGEITQQGNTGVFNQTAGMLIVDGSMEQENINITGGSVFGTGSIQSAQDMLIGSGATLNPGNSVGQLDILGNLDLEGVLTMEIEGLSSYDMLNISGNLDLTGGGQLQIDLLGGYLPDFGSSFNLLTAETIEGQFDLALLPELGGSLYWDIQYLVDYSGSTDLVKARVVPIPGAVWLFGSALAGLGWMRRKQLTAEISLPAPDR